MSTQQSTPPIVNGNGTSRSLAIAELDEEIELMQRRLDTLIQARDMLKGIDSAAARAAVVTRRPITTTTEGGLTVANGVERILAEVREMHIDNIREELERRFAIQVTKKNLSNILNRWISRGAKFRRPKTNTYALQAVPGNWKFPG